MSAKIKADGDTWRAEVCDEGSDRLVLFFCTTTDQRPYRVVRVARDRFPDAAALEAAAEDELTALFEASRSMGIPEEYPTYGR